MDQLSSLFANRAPIFASVAVLLGAVFLISTFRFFHSAATKIPLVGEEIGDAEKRRSAFITNAKDIYAKGYGLFRDKAWRLTDVDGAAPSIENSILHGN